MGKRRKYVYTAIALAVFFVFLFWADGHLDNYKLRVFNLAGIYVILALSLNLVNGFTGLFSLGTAGFMAVGAYVSALLTMSPDMKQMSFFLEPLIWPLNVIQISFLPALLLAGLISAVFGFLIGAPVLKLKGDYLAIATLGFAEIIRVVIINLQNITNGALGLKGIPEYTNIWWSWGTAVFTIALMVSLMNSSYGRAFKAIREDEIAAEAMGINLFKHKVLSFTLSSFLAGIGGALMGNLITTVDPTMFMFPLTFQILLIVVLGGMGSITGSVISAVIVTILMEALRVVESPMHLGFIDVPGIPGMRMVIFSALLMIVILFYRQGFMGQREFTWEWFCRKEKSHEAVGS
ncbi:MAG: branched-chain amino acid transport system permease protein [Thermosediminibacterales bacterium]|nr:branched-chain amino acid transport system permease protein [Thermosediminibacterales bacterium]